MLMATAKAKDTTTMPPIHQIRSATHTHTRSAMATAPITAATPASDEPDEQQGGQQFTTRHP
jgi:hypothetical protein